MGIFLALLAWWAWPAIVLGIIYVIYAIPFSGYGVQNGIETWLYNSFLHGNVVWIFVLVWSLVSLVIAFMMGSDTNDSGEKTAGAIFGLANTFLFVLSIALLVGFNVNLDKYEARYYANSVTFYVNNPSHLPESVHLLGDGAATNTDDCAVLYRGTDDDTHGCVKQGELPADGWIPRVGSHDTAVQALKNSSGATSATNLDPDTVAYLNSSKAGTWSGIIDGSGIQVPLGGVAEWDGHGVSTQCTFTGDYALDRAFKGEKSNNLTNLIAERYPMLSYQMTDVWGYCRDMGDGKAKQPIIVIPATRPVPYSHRTVDAPAGIIIVRGDHGKTVLEYRTDSVAGDEFPGPVYPASLTAKQRDMSAWSAGRQNNERNHFGFEPTDDQDVQTGSVSEFLLMDPKTNRLEYVTPLTLRGSTSQLFVAFAISYADEVHAGKLNPVSIYVSDDNDNRRVPIRNLVSAANNWLAQNQPWLKSNGTTLKEFEPINGDTWRGYLENNNQVQFMLDVVWDGASQSLAKTVLIPAAGGPPVPVAPNAPAPGVEPVGPTATAFCGQPLDQLSVAQLQQCATAAIGALGGRAH
jgi:hypothetical protein